MLIALAGDQMMAKVIHTGDWGKFPTSLVIGITENAHQISSTDPHLLQRISMMRFSSGKSARARLSLRRKEQFFSVVPVSLFVPLSFRLRAAN